MSTSPFISFTFWSLFNFTIQPTISRHISSHNSSMKDLSLFLLKNSLAAKMKRGIRSFCNGVGSTSTLDQKKKDCDVSCLANDSYMDDNPLTLEEMILQLDLEEEAARRAKIDDYSELNRRMSCVNNSDILRSARNAAMNQYPRFSLDGRDAMYRSSFRNYGGVKPGRRSVCCSSSTRGGCMNTGYEVNFDGNIAYPPTVAGESVVWCQPGVVAKLMGLDAVPVPVRPGRSRVKAGAFSSRKENLRRMGRYELEKERLLMNMNGYKGGSNYNPGRYCVMKPVNIEPMNGPLDWNYRHARR